MKPNRPLAASLVLALLALWVAAWWISATNVTTFAPGGIVEQTYPDWLVALAGIVIPVGFLVLLSLAFVPSDRTRRALPVWFRARWYVPALCFLWSQIGLYFPFTPHQLTHVLPGFLLGSDDWGSGNIYTFTKLADWLSLLAGCLACARLPGDPLPAARGFAERFRLCLPHLVAAIVPHLLNGGELDTPLLYLWLLVGFTAVVALQSLSDDPTRRWPRLLPWLAATAWLFVPVALQRP